MRISDWSSDVCSSDLFSGCILKGKEPEPSGLEGLIDVQIIEALYESAKTRKPVKLPKFPRKPRPTLAQQIKLPPVKKPEVIKDRKSVVSGKSVSVRVDLGGRRIIKKHKKITHR